MYHFDQKNGQKIPFKQNLSRRPVFPVMLN
jgi:hypothetical protein